MTEVIHDKGKLELDLEKGNSIDTLRDLIVADSPVLIETISHNTALRNLYPTLKRILFYASGKVKSDLSLSPRTIRGRETFAEASHAREKTDWGMDDYTLCTSRGSNTPRAVKPYSYNNRQYNEGTFSPAGGTSWMTFSDGGTTRILTGKTVEKDFGSELRAIRFAEEGFVFDIPPFYSMPGYLITQKGVKEDEKNARKSELSSIICVTATRNLLAKATWELNAKRENGKGMNHDLTVAQIGWWKRGYEMFVKEGYPVNDEDYAINELSHPSRLVGFVKVSRGGLYGRTFVYPTPFARPFFELAYSDEFISRYFPEGSKKPK